MTRYIALVAAVCLVSMGCTASSPSVPPAPVSTAPESAAPSVSAAPSLTPNAASPSPGLSATPPSPSPSPATPSPSPSPATPSPSPSPGPSTIGLDDLDPCASVIRTGTALAPSRAPRTGQGGAFVGYLVTAEVPQGTLEVRQGRAGLSTGPFGPFIALVDRARDASALQVVDMVRGCLAVDVRRSGLVFQPQVDPALSAIYFHPFTESEPRMGKGAWRVALGGDQSEQVLPAWEADSRFKRTWSSTIAWTADGSLVDQDCELTFCRSRVLDSDGRLQVYSRPVHGPFISGTASTLRVYGEVCDTNDCPVVEINRRTGQVTHPEP